MQFRYEGGSEPVSKEYVFRELVNRNVSILGRAGFNRVGVGVERRGAVLWVALIFVSV